MSSANGGGVSARDLMRSTAAATQEGLRLFVAGIPFHIDEATLRLDFGKCGVIEDLLLLRGPNGNSTGKSYITFRDHEAKKACLALDDTDYHGRKIFVKLFKDRRARQDERRVQKHQNISRQNSTKEKPEGCVSLCLKNPSGKWTSEEYLRAYLTDAGCQVESVRIVRPHGRPTGVAFVQFTSTEDVDKAMALPKTLDGHAVVMDYSVSKVQLRPSTCMSVVVKKLAPETQKADMKRLLNRTREFGKITDLHIVCAPGTEQCTGLAFVNFSTPSAVEAAVRLSGTQFGGRTIFVGYEKGGRRPGVARKEMAITRIEQDEEAILGEESSGAEIKQKRHRVGGEKLADKKQARVAKGRKGHEAQGLSVVSEQKSVRRRRSLEQFEKEPNVPV
eukprot:gnl/TRDRNA2_/TRDRNA2_144245_c1_seq1.p1 gnl/TRDRNA2_/TRDRNA2_144245_c1~~gnl/TRDRNA2_/TRDRNA2_144245_c1_seq1.p1  ORF type:complete len:390 (-),score=53.77 gnl/TRDRNA2_/TRDRNA2_144245_c1_seq1:463-1632(-)